MPALPGPPGAFGPAVPVEATTKANRRYVAKSAGRFGRRPVDVYCRRARVVACNGSEERCRCQRPSVALGRGHRYLWPLVFAVMVLRSVLTSSITGAPALVPITS